eukprot:COSAG06_NODE_561_length_14287_cov_13.422047_7_plen_75_part_00
MACGDHRLHTDEMHLRTGPVRKTTPFRQLPLRRSGVCLGNSVGKMKTNNYVSLTTEDCDDDDDDDGEATGRARL